MTISKAHVTWTATALGADFAATYVQRLHSSGWCDIAKSTTEATAAFDDWEGYRGAQESYRVLVEDVYGVRSTPPSAVTVTLTTDTFIMVSNQNPAINTALNVEYPLTVGLPERALTVATVGRHGQRLHRSSDQLGETMDWVVNMPRANGPEMWRTLVTNLRSDLPYVCILDPWGHRWFAGVRPTSVNMRFFNYSDLAANLVEVTDTPYVVTF